MLGTQVVNAKFHFGVSLSEDQILLALLLRERSFDGVRIRPAVVVCAAMETSTGEDA